ncbi:Craniofacial development protein 2 [Varanus komodoensis]|nr:Craniofacial development protein 2 [Varanus komodoensis]
MRVCQTGQAKRHLLTSTVAEQSSPKNCPLDVSDPINIRLAILVESDGSYSPTHPEYTILDPKSLAMKVTEITMFLAGGGKGKKNTKHLNTKQNMTLYNNSQMIHIQDLSVVGIFPLRIMEITEHQTSQIILFHSTIIVEIQSLEKFIKLFFKGSQTRGPRANCRDGRGMGEGPCGLQSAGGARAGRRMSSPPPPPPPPRILDAAQPHPDSTSSGPQQLKSEEEEEEEEEEEAEERSLKCSSRAFWSTTKPFKVTVVIDMLADERGKDIPSMDVQDNECTQSHTVLLRQLSSHQSDNAINLLIALGQGFISNKGKRTGEAKPGQELIHCKPSRDDQVQRGPQTFSIGGQLKGSGYTHGPVKRGRLGVQAERNGNPLQYPCHENPMDSINRQRDMMLEDELLMLEGVQCATGKEQRASTNRTRKNEVTGSKPKGHSVADVSGGERKVRCCKDLYSTGTWNVRSMNQGKLDMVKQEMTRLNISILGISELKWTGMGEFNSDDHQRRFYTWTSPDGQLRNQIDYVLCSQRWRSSIHSVKTRPGADCDSDHELLVAKFRLKLKKVGKSTRPLRYDLNHIPDEYTVEVTNRFKGLGLIDRVPEELWTEVCNIVQEVATKTIPKKKKCKKAKWLSEEALQIAEERREAKGKGERKRYTQLNAECQRIARRDKKAFLNEQCKEIEENNKIGKTRDLFKKIEDMKRPFHAKTGMIKDKNGRDLTEAEEIKKRWQDYTEELYKKDLNIPDN